MTRLQMGKAQDCQKLCRAVATGRVPMKGSWSSSCDTGIGEKVQTRETCRLQILA